MPIDLSGGLNLDLSLPQRPDGYILLAVYVLLALALLFVSRRTFRGLRLAQWALFSLLLPASVLLNSTLLVPVSTLLPLPILPQAPPLPPVPLLGLLPVILGGMWIGVGPAMLIGLAGGAARWLLGAGRITQPAEIALFAVVVAFLLQQNYRGWLAGVLRRPFVASLAAGVLSSLLILPFAIYATASGDVLAALDYAISVFVFGALLAWGESLLNGLLCQLADLAFPSLRRPLPGTETPVYARNLNRRLLFTILPITFITITFQVVVVGVTAMDEARRQAVAQLSRNAQAAVELLDTFFVDGQAVLEQFAADDRLQTPDAEAQRAQLAAAISTVAFFDEMLLVDAQDQIVASVHLNTPTASAPLELTDEEHARVQRARASGAPQRTGVHGDGQGSAMISFVQPIVVAGATRDVLIGRTRLSINPRIGVIKRNLADTPDLGIGYLVDENNRIIVHPDPELELGQWIFDRDQPPYATIPGGGRAYIDLFPDNTRRFIFVQEAAGTPWTVAIERPYSNILGTAAQISAPLVVMFAVIMVGALVLLPLISRRITQPLGGLAQAAGRITTGELDRPVPDMGEDEVGQLGLAFEGMRRSLKARLDDLSLLLHVSQAVATSLDLERGIPPILDAAMQVTLNQARTARLVVLDDLGQPARVIACGDGPPQVTPLDAALANVTLRDERPLKVENVARAHGALDPNLVGPGVRAIMALPLRRSNRPLGIIWLGYAEARQFPETEVSLLSTLVGQAAVFIENVNLFEAAEGGRQRLQAVLSSTNDAVLVTDRENRVLLCNPAAEIAFGLPRGGAVGQPVHELIGDQVVVDLLTERGDPVVRTAEVAMPDGRTLYGSAASISAGDGLRIGRVAVLRDITHLKEVDAMKNEFVATVSHDLRSPLTYMRGYVTMIPMVGPTEPKQQDYLDKIMGGIEQMTILIDDLLDLGRIEAGVGIVRETVTVADVAREAIDSMQGQALARKMTLNLDASAQGALQGDRQLLKHAIANLIDNSIKYTQAGGWVQVSIEEREGQVIVRVSDNGIGIAPADQPRLFEKFYRVKRRDTIDIKGTGLGLAIVKSIVEWHHGRAWVESQLGKGSTFYIALPVEG
ncbi:MAG TPA: ATP-binding protein [Anaerolineae bacterium]|nr:ATP-binding protein [Anaerolineae bacterium]